MEKHRPRSEEKDWQRRLQEWEQGANAQGWDSPTDGLWDRIASDLPDSPPPKKRAVWVWWSIAGFLLLLGIIGYRSGIFLTGEAANIVGENSSTKKSQVNESVTPSPEQNPTVEGETAVARPTTTDDQVNSSSTHTPDLDPASTTTSNAPLPDVKKSEQANSVPKVHPLKTIPASEVEGGEEEPAADIPIAISGEEQTIPSPSVSDPVLMLDEQTLVESIDPISIEADEAPIDWAPKVKQLNSISLLPTILEPITISQKLNLGAPTPSVYPSFKGYVGLQVGIPSARQQIRGPHRIRQQSFDPRVELWIGRELGTRWQVEVGYAQEGSQLLRQTSFIRRFDPQHEQVQDDQNVTTYKLNILDDSGSAKDEVEVKLVRRPGQSVLPGDRVLIQTDIQEQVRVRAIPVRVGYDLLRYRSFQLQTLVGVEWQRQYRSLELERVLVLHPRFDSLTLPDRQRQREQQRDVFRFTTGLRTSIQLSPRWGLYLQPQWSWGNANAKTQDFHLSAGISWRF